MNHRLVVQRAFLALPGVIESIAVGQGLAVDEIGGIKIYAELSVRIGCLLQLPSGIAHGIHTAVELADNVYLVFGSGALRHYNLEQLVTVAQFEPRQLNVECDFLFRASCQEREHHKKEKTYKTYSFSF